MEVNITDSLDGANLRNILGHYPTGVCAITSMDEGVPIGIVVGSFTSVSLDPPLVAFFPGRKSTSWPAIGRTGRFCVNVLSEDQRDICDAFSSKADNKFRNVSYRLSETGLPIISDALAWINCDIDIVHEAGDHFIVIGKINSLAVAYSHSPLLFLKGTYGQFVQFPSKTL